MTDYQGGKINISKEQINDLIEVVMSDALETCSDYFEFRRRGGLNHLESLLALDVPVSVDDCIALKKCKVPIARVSHLYQSLVDNHVDIEVCGRILHAFIEAVVRGRLTVDQAEALALIGDESGLGGMRVFRFPAEPHEGGLQ